MLLLYASNVEEKWVDSNFQIIDLLVQPRAAGVARTLLLFTLQFCYTTTLAACTIFYLLYFNSLCMHKGPCTFMCPSATQSYVIKLSCSRKVYTEAFVCSGEYKEGPSVRAGKRRLVSIFSDCWTLHLRVYSDLKYGR